VHFAHPEQGTRQKPVLQPSIIIPKGATQRDDGARVGVPLPKTGSKKQENISYVELQFHIDNTILAR
jgi:hypothetical protein